MCGQQQVVLGVYLRNVLPSSDPALSRMHDAIVHCYGSVGRKESFNVSGVMV